MKKSVALILGIMLLAMLLVMTGCSKRTNVVFTVDGVEDLYVLPVSYQNIDHYSRQEDEHDPELITYSFLLKTDGDYDFQITDRNGMSYIFTLKNYNGKVEAVAPEGIKVNLTIK